MAKSVFLYALYFLVCYSYLVLIIRNDCNYLWKGCNQYFLLYCVFFFYCFFLITDFHFYFLMAKLNQVEWSGWMGRDWFSHREHWITFRSMEWLSEGHRACVSGKPSKASLGRNITSLKWEAGSSSQLDLRHQRNSWSLLPLRKSLT